SWQGAREQQPSDSREMQLVSFPRCVTSASVCRRTIRRGFRNPILPSSTSFVSCWRRNLRESDSAARSLDSTYSQEVELKISKERLAQIVRAFPSVELLVIGDLILDSYLECRALGVANEAPVPLVEIQSQRQAAGGAGNVATNLARLGILTRLV